MERQLVTRIATAVVLVAGVSANRLPPEIVDQPPAERSARENPSARSAPATVVQGAYVSIQVNVDATGQNVVGDAANEPSIAVNPLDPRNMVVAWRQFDSVASSFRQAGWAYTFDGGLHWTFPGVLTPGTFRSDPVVDASSSGVFYYQSLKSNFLLDTFFSLDGGVSWSSPLPSYGGDKNWLAVDRSGGIGDGNVYGIWPPYASCCERNVFTRLNLGEFEPPVPVASWPTFGTMTVGHDGAVFATGLDGTEGGDSSQFVVARSLTARDLDQYPTFTASAVNLDGSIQISAGPNPGGLLGQANVAADASTGATRGFVYVVASVVPAGGGDPMDVHFARSTDGGVTWSPPVRVNDDAPGSWQWLAAHAVAPNGRIDVVWLDTRDSGIEHVSRLNYAYSWDGGLSWSANVPVSPSFDSWVGWPEQQSKIGDYMTLVSGATGADVAYPATFNGEEDVWYVRVYPDCNDNAVSDVSDLEDGASLDCDDDRIPDECEPSPTCIGAGGVPDGGAALTVDRGAAGALALAWEASCATADSDYAVYEGELGSFASHARRNCSTGGARTWTLSPLPGDRYFLVVPVHADREGSYGTSGAGVERPPGVDACVPQAFAGCATAASLPGSARTGR
jgi:hypothetical protein